MSEQSTKIRIFDAGETVTRFLLVFVVCLCVFCFAQPSHAAVVWSGDINPTDPITWTSSTYSYIGNSGDGTVTITDGDDVVNGYCHMGYNPGSTGEVTVDGAGSTWTNADLSVGMLGIGILHITNGGSVSSGSSVIGYISNSASVVTVDGTGSMFTNSSDLSVQGTLNIINSGVVTTEGDSFVSRYTGTLGAIHFDNGTLATGGLGCNFDSLTGTGTINTSGLFSDIDLVFDAELGLNQTFTINDNSAQNITINLDVDGSGSLGAGYSNMGTLRISDGRVVESKNGYIGFKSGSTGEVTVDGTGSAWTNRSYGYLYVGHSGNGTLNISDGGSVSNGNGYIGDYSGSTGEVTVDGVGSTWTNNFSLNVGMHGNGTLNITGGGMVKVENDTWLAYYAGSSGTINFDNGTLTTASLVCAFNDLNGVGTINTHGLVSDVDLAFDATHGPNQTFMINDNPGQNIALNLDVDGSGSLGAGYSGVGTMSISDARVIQSHSGVIGVKSGSKGQVTVDGIGSAWMNTGNLQVGLSGSGMLNISGGSVSNGFGFIGFSSGSTGKVVLEGAGSMWTNNGLLQIGNFGTGTLDIIAGGTVSNTIGYIGFESGSSGEVTVDGAGSTWTNSDSLNIGHSGNGKLSITSGGSVGNNRAYIGTLTGSAGQVTVDGAGSTWMNSDALTINDGTLNITDGGAASNRNGYIGLRPGSTGKVIVDGAGSTWTNRSHLHVGNTGSGTLNITDGGLVIVVGTLTIDYNEDGDDFINITAGGMLALHGDGDDSLAAFLELVDGTDAIRYWDYSISDWGDISDATCGRDYTLNYLTEGSLDGFTLLTVELAIEGDANNDGKVGDADATILASNWLTKSGASWGMGDFNGDGAVDAVDATLLAANWQRGVSGDEQSVPEPSTIALLLVGVINILVYPRRKIK